MHQGKRFGKRRKRKRKIDDPLLGRGLSQEIERPEVQDKLPGYSSSSEDFKAVWLVIACTMAIGAGLMSGGIILIIRGKHNNVTDFLVLGSCGVVTGLCFSVAAVVRMYKSMKQSPPKDVERQHGRTLPARRNSASRAARVKSLNEQKSGCQRITKKNKQGVDGDQLKLLIESDENKSTARDSILSNKNKSTARDSILSNKNKSTARDSILSNQNKSTARDSILSNQNKSTARNWILSNQNKSTARDSILSNQNKSTARDTIQANQNKTTNRDPFQSNQNNSTARSVHFTDVYGDFQNEGLVLTKFSHNGKECIPLGEVSTNLTVSQSSSRVNKNLDNLSISNSDAARKQKKFKATTISTKTVEFTDDKNSKTASASEREPVLEPSRHKSELKIVLSTNTGLKGGQGIVSIKKNTEPAAVHTLVWPNRKTNDMDTALVRPSSRHLIKTVVDITPYNPDLALTTIDMLPSHLGHSDATIDILPSHLGHTATMIDMLPSHLGHTDPMTDMLPSHLGHTVTTADMLPSRLGHNITTVDMLPFHLGHTVTAGLEIFTPARVISHLDHGDVKHLCDSGKSSIDSSSMSQSFDEGDTKEANIFCQYFPQIWDQSAHSLKGSHVNNNGNSSPSFSRTDPYLYDPSEQTIKKQVWSKRGGLTVSRQLMRNHGIYVMDDQIEVLDSE